MVCAAVQAWSLSGLVAAFLDLTIAYLLLCASAAAYVASKILGFFGLSLPCPCDMIFLNIDGKILCLNRLLVDYPGQRISDVQLSVAQKFPFSQPRKRKYIVDGDYNRVDGVPVMECEASCSSDTRMTTDLARKEYDLKGKEIKCSNRCRGRLRHRKGDARGKISYLASCDRLPDRDALGGGQFGNSSTLPVGNDEARDLEYDNKDPTEAGLRERSIPSVENHSNDANMHEKKIYIEELQNHPQRVQRLSGDEENILRLLEQTLEEERIARASLYIELEKERSAAASAADEAMAMILRLQEEKASIEIEARQYQRILEEKSAYDAEEMNILKEILVRREKEKLFLEKEVEAYKQVICIGNEQDENPNSGYAFEDEISVRFHNENSSFGNQRDLDRNSVQMNVELLEKEITSADNKSRLNVKVLEEIQDKNQEDKPAEKIIVTCNGNETGGHTFHDPCLKQEAKDGQAEPSASSGATSVKNPHFDDVGIERDGIKKSSSETSCGVPPMKPSLSAVESEMVKIDCEVGRLRERLRLIQEGRYKLSHCAESRERENLQLKLLEDLASQVQEIRQLTGPGKTLRHSSLPLPTSKVLSKRRSRNVCSVLQRSSECMIPY